jgi:hypothetical protein
MGLFLVQKPLSLLKSGSPDSVLIPAPVKITVLLLVFTNLMISLNLFTNLLLNILQRV